jgi:hypothetical protein
MKIVYEVKNDTPRLMRLPEMSFIDDGPGKTGRYQRADW